MTITLAALALLPALAQDFEYDLRPPERSAWLEAGQSVAIEGDWAVVGGFVPTSPFAPPPGLPALFRRDAAERAWNHVRRLDRPGVLNNGHSEYGVSIDGEHMLVVMGSQVASLRFDASLDDWVDGPLLVPPPGTAGFSTPRVHMEGDRAIVWEIPAAQPGTGRTIHTYEFDPAIGAWTWMDSLSASTGRFLARARLFGDELITWVDHDDLHATPAQLWIHAWSAGAWARTQVIDGAQLGSTDPFFGGPFDAEGDLLATADDFEILVFERAGPGAPFMLTERLDGNLPWSMSIEDGAIVAGGPYIGSVEVWRQPACLGGDWTRTHRLTTINKHHGAHLFAVDFGRALDVDGDHVIVGAPEYALIGGPFHALRSGAASIFPIAPDLDGDGVEDICPGGSFPEDVDGDGILDVVESPGSRYCSPNVPTSLGAPASILLQGSERVADNRLVVTMLGVPQGSYGLMIAGLQPGFVPNAGINDGNLCIAGGVARRAGRTHPFWFAQSDNVIHQEFDTSYSPWGTQYPLLPGETWYFQGWFRDGATSNMTDAMRVFFE